MSEVAEAVAVGRVKWFNPKKGFGFVVSDQIEGDVLVHYSLFKKHGLRGAPEGAILEFTAAKGERGMQATEVLSVDLRDAKPQREFSSGPHATTQRIGNVGDWEVLEVRWYNRPRGYGFLSKGEDDVFVHADTLRSGGFEGAAPGELIEARVGHGVKGLIAAEVRRVAA